MKQICTQIALFALLVIAQNAYAQSSVTMSKINPNPSPAFGAPDSVKASSGYTSTNTGTFHDFAPNRTDTIVSPQYYYTSPQTTIYFDLSCSASASGADATVKVLIITASGDTLSAIDPSTETFKGASIDYYFTFILGTTLPANTAFKIAVIMTTGNKAVAANTLTVNARRGTPPAPAPLPVNFAGFYAKKLSIGVALIWNVGTEDNVQGYDVQKSTDGKTFNSIGFVTANHSSSYNFTDSKSVESAYYRIRSVDNDGKFMYSSIVSITGQQSSVVMKAFPTPVQTNLTIQHNTADNNTRIEVYTADGRLMKTTAVVSGSQQTNIDLSSAKAGVYVVRFVNDANIETLKVVKQ
jgi:hypothetical protein